MRNAPPPFSWNRGALSSMGSISSKHFVITDGHNDCDTCCPIRDKQYHKCFCNEPTTEEAGVKPRL